MRMSQKKTEEKAKEEKQASEAEQKANLKYQLLLQKYVSESDGKKKKEIEKQADAAKKENEIKKAELNKIRQEIVVPSSQQLEVTRRKAEVAKAKEPGLRKRVEEAEKKVTEAKQKLDAERAKEVALQAKIAELENEVYRLETELKGIDESDSEDYVKEGLRAPLQSELDAKRTKLSTLEELSDKIDELDAEIAKLEKNVEYFKKTDAEQTEQYLAGAG